MDKKPIEELFIEVKIGNEIKVKKFSVIADWFERNFPEEDLTYEVDLTFSSIRVVLNGSAIDTTNSKELAGIITLSTGVSVYPCLDGTVGFVLSFKMKV